ncbi:MAG: endonuclease [Crocinitomicaceae bacterium]|nr:endonuclease [Crocinitomicaceae bacterium]
MKKLLLSLSVFVGALSFAQSDINDARTNYSVGQTVTIRGLVQNGDELGPIRYIQDATGGLPAYGGILSSVNRGDSITVTGVLFDYNGLLEISPTNSFNVLAAPSVIIPPLEITIPDMSETYEGQLIKIVNVTITGPGSFAANTNYDFSDGVNTGQLRISTNSNLVGQTIPAGPVTIVGLQGEYSGTYQMLPRDQNDIIAYTPPAEEINITIGGQTYLTGTDYVIGTTANTTVTIENLGATNNLTISGITYSGAAASDYSVSGAPTSITPGGNATFDIVFAPSTGGSKIATLEIASNDADENPYLINLYGIGTDNLATEPSANPSNLTFPVNTSYALTGNFTSVGDAESYLVLWKKGSAVSGAPMDGTTYLRGDVVGDATVAYVGSSAAFTPRHVIANQDMHFAIYSFNGPAGFENYVNTTPLTGNKASLDNMMGSYYSGMDAQITSFPSDLSTLINPHTQITYGNYKATVINQFELRDTIADSSVITCAYSGENKVFYGAFDWTTLGYSREHTYSHSWMPTYPADAPYPGLPEYSDQHNLYPTNLYEANTPRSNLPLGNVVNPVDSYLEGQTGYDANNVLVYEPRDMHKGNAARSIFYMAICYNGVSGNNWGIPTNQDQDVLKAWHFQDLPDDYEIARNDYIHSVQGNRNPFIDSTDWVCFIDFYDLSYVSAGCNLSTEEIEMDQSFKIYPVPSTGELNIATKNLNGLYEIDVTDVSGKIVYSLSNVNLSQLFTMNLEHLNSGYYIVSISDKNIRLNKPFVIK